MKTACQAAFGCATSNCTDGEDVTTCDYIPDPSDDNPVGDESDSTTGAYTITCSCADLGLAEADDE